MNDNGWWLRNILAARSLAGLRESLVTIVHRAGFKFFLLCGRCPLNDGYQEVRIENCPSSWLEYCAEHKFAGASDPMHRLTLQETTPVLWREKVAHYPEYFAAARRFGLITGVTHPVHGPLGDRSSMTFIKGVGGMQAEREILDTLPECQLVACYAHKALAYIVEKHLDLSIAGKDQPIPALTQRERECLSWAATGKTAAETALTLSLSETTIIYHLSNARRKLEAENSRHAISRAIALKLISPN